MNDFSITIQIRRKIQSAFIQVIAIKFGTYHGYAMKEVSINSNSLYETNWFSTVVFSVTTAIYIDFCLKKLHVFSQHIGKKKMNIWIPKNRSQGIKMLIWFLCYTDPAWFSLTNERKFVD